MKTKPRFVLLNAFKLLATAGPGPYQHLAKRFSLPPLRLYEAVLTTNLPPSIVAALCAARCGVPQYSPTAAEMLEMSQPAKVMPRPSAEKVLQSLWANGYQVRVFGDAAVAYVEAFYRAFPTFRTLPCFWSCEMGHLITDTPTVAHVQKTLRVQNPTEIFYMSHSAILSVISKSGWYYSELDGNTYENPQAPLEDLLPRIQQLAA